jgi:IS4 transposase
MQSGTMHGAIRVVRSTRGRKKGTRVTQVVGKADCSAQIGEHLSIGALFKTFPLAKVKAALRAEGKESIRERALPNHVVVYYVLMLAIFMSDSYREVMRRLLEGFKHARRNRDGVQLLGKSGISQARTRLGHSPLKRLYDDIVRPIATEKTRGAWYKRWLVVSLDGSTLDVADTPENDEEFGRSEGDRGPSAFPKIRLVTLIESGTRVLFGAVMGAYGGANATSEMDLAWRVIGTLKKGMLCLADRYYLGFEFWEAARATGADLLWRVKSRHILEPQQQLPDGSYLSKIYPTQYDRKVDRNGVVVRVIEYKFKWQRNTEVYKLITTVLDHEQAPAEELGALYHERWEIETSLGEVKTHMRGAGTVLRSKTPELVRQEFYGFLLAYFAVRGVMHEAALEADEDPDKLSFLHAIKVIRRKIPAFGIFPPAALV